MSYCLHISYFLSTYNILHFCLSPCLYLFGQLFCAIHRSSRSQVTQKGPLTDALRTLSLCYHSAPTKPFSPKLLFSALCDVSPMFKSLEQQDSQKMFAALVNGMFEEDETRWVLLCIVSEIVVLVKIVSIYFVRVKTCYMWCRFNFEPAENSSKPKLKTVLFRNRKDFWYLEFPVKCMIRHVF